MTPTSPAFAARDVSRETIERLSAFEALLRKWNPAINLVARSTIDDVWQRHFHDSIQIFDAAPGSARLWADFGTGGGFPGLVVAILAANERQGLRTVLIESDQRKAAFLATAVRNLELNAIVLAERAEAVEPLGADIVSARALAPLTVLLELAERHLAPGGTALFPKGAGHSAELARALDKWSFTHHKTPSKTDPDAVILSIGGIRRV
ncbi:Ribosomal RNA small subunit methyltransferase G [Defluviimonas aquaemixtae]|uniref:Ribosomal RNA small subunit methyltransferase G n=1 Tax=Albidovulum aquaemixtae TaxID=1542388 RepID=A0A2R8BJG7_9RHOB|nr:16S rRNA (guanine(527)-N(7))-methyltransferase RsmG [Defluviimonas aquaemixtae]SPH23551.1 Ribosomal RNA small subunit methyltransferase G [Defluviimonas aquaemixtae]